MSEEQNRYQRTFLVSSSLISVPCFLMVTAGALGGHFIQSLLGAAIATSCWSAYLALQSNRRHAFAWSFVVASLVWTFSLVLVVRMVEYARLNPALEGASGRDSPAAFFADLVFVLFLFVPASLVIVRGVIETVRNGLSHAQMH